MKQMVVIGLETSAVRAGGLNRYVENYVAGLRRHGVSVTCLEIGASGSPSPSASVLRRVGWVARRARSLRATPVLDVHFALYGAIPMVMAPRGTHRIVHFHGPWAKESGVEGASPLVQRAKHAVERFVYRRATVVVVLSDAFKDLLVEDYGVAPHRITVIGGGVDTAHFSPGDRAAARASFNLDGDGPVLVMVRRLVNRMGHEILIEALGILASIGIMPSVLIVGDGPGRSKLAATIRSAGLEHRVHLLGSLPDDRLPDAYRAADCSVVPSTSFEGFGLVALESLACATPVVASRVGGIAELLERFDDDVLCAPGDATDLARVLTSVLSGHGPSREACRRFSLERSWDAVVAQHLRLIAPARHKVLYLGHGARLSGGELALLRQLPTLHGVAPTVVLAEDGPLVDELTIRGVPVEVVAMSPRLRETRRAEVTLRTLGLGRMRDLVAYVVELRATVKRLQPDIIHTNTLKAALIGGVVGRLTRTPVVWQVRDRIASDYLPSSAVALVRFLSRLLPTAVLGNSTSTLATVPGGRYRAVVPSPLDPQAGPGPRGSGPFTVTMVGRLSPWKGQDLFLEAFAEAFPYGDARARIVGEALFGEEEYAEALHGLAEALGIADRVEFLGFRRDIAELLQTSDVQVVASRIPEPFGNVVLEGMACGVAVVAPDAGGPAELLVNGETGVLVPPDDVHALAEALEVLAGDQALRSRLSSAAQLDVAKYRPERLAQRYLDCYTALRDPKGWA